MKHRRLIALLVAGLALAACGDEPSGTPETLTLISHDSFAFEGVEEVFAPFVERTGIDVQVIAVGDAGELVTQAVLTKDNPLADVLFGVDDTFLSRALENGIFRSYRATGIAAVDGSLLEPDDMATPISFGDVCINYDKQWFADSGGTVPTSLDDFRDPDVAGLLALMHPATSSPGLAFMLATIDRYGEDGWLDFWRDVHAGNPTVTSGWSDAYYSEFSRHGGDHPLVVSYASSPPAEVMFADEPSDTAPTGVITDGCYRQVEYAGILEGTDYPEAAGQLIDYMLSVEFQEQIPDNWFVYPTNRDAELSPIFAEHTVLPDNPTRFDTDYISSSRERWINEWISVMESR